MNHNSISKLFEMKKIAAERGGKCLSKQYVNSKTKLLWECSLGHKWEAIPNSIKTGSWCPVCGSEKRAKLSRGNIKNFKQNAESRGGKCLSDNYINSQTKLLWECSKGHKWEASPVNIKRGSWCPYCAGNTKGNLEKMRHLAKERGGICVSDKYLNSQTKLLWRCLEGHEWYATPSSIKRGDWCPYCAGKAKGTIEEMRSLAESRGGKCLSSQYINTMTNLVWECSEGHKFKSTPTRVKIGQWCPECSSGLGERITREFFQQLFGKKFPRVRLKWLINKDGNIMELDGYCHSLMLAFEHQGEQHYSLKTHYIKNDIDLTKRQTDDLKKKELCTERNIALIEIPEIPGRLSIDDVKDYIKKQCQSLHINIPDNYTSINVNLRNAYNAPESVMRLAELKALANKNGGRCLSKTYKGSKTKLQWECEKGHKWWATPESIKNSLTWCVICAGKAKGNIQQMHQIAKSKGGQCLSEHYLNISTKLLWQCNKGHTWKATPQSVKSGSWCPVCGTERTAKVLKDSLETFKIIAKKRNGKCLSDKYINSSTKLLWECSEGHQWEARAHDVKRGSWCPYCSKTAPKKIDDMKALAQKKEGECLSDQYINAHTKLIWECKFGHQWEAKPNNIQSGSWCPVCAKNTIRHPE